MSFRKLRMMRDDDFRETYLDAHIRAFLAMQFRSLRGDETQKDFAKKLGVTQSMISRYENHDYGKMTVQTLIDVANKLKIGLEIKFISYESFVENTSDVNYYINNFGDRE